MLGGWNWGYMNLQEKLLTDITVFVMSILFLQGDCLHNCYPSKMDAYSILMLHYLKQQRTDQDIQALYQTVTQKSLWDVTETTEFRPDLTEAAKKLREARERENNPESSENNKNRRRYW